MHWYVDIIAERTKGGQRSSVKLPDYEFIQSLGIGTKIKDAKGRNEAGLIKEKKQML